MKLENIIVKSWKEIGSLHLADRTKVKMRHGVAYFGLHLRIANDNRIQTRRSIYPLLFMMHGSGGSRFDIAYIQVTLNYTTYGGQNM